MFWTVTGTALGFFGLVVVAVGLRVFVGFIGRRSAAVNVTRPSLNAMKEMAVTALSWTFGLGLAVAFLCSGVAQLIPFWPPGILGGVVLSGASAGLLAWMASRVRRG